TTWTIMFPTFRVCKSVFEKRNPQVRIVIGFPLLSLRGKYPQAKCPVCLRHRRHRLRPGRPRPPANRLGQAARPARRRGDREQEVVGLRSNVVLRHERNGDAAFRAQRGTSNLLSDAFYDISVVRERSCADPTWQLGQRLEVCPPIS